MSAVTANDLDAADIEAADALALARLDDDGAPCPSDLPGSQPGRRQLTPALVGVG